MTKLKTLKDIKELKGGKTILRAEAIEWVKRFGSNPNVEHYFMTFFNLTENDLK